MALSLYMDHNVSRAITDSVRVRGVDVLTAFEDGAHELPDPELLDRATTLGRILFTLDTDFLVEAARRQADNIPFTGIIFATQRRIFIGTCVRDLEKIAKTSIVQDLTNTVTFLPLHESH